MSLLIVIVNYRTAPLVNYCLASLAGQIDEVPGTHVIVVDNASGDDSVQQISQNIDRNGWKWVTLVASKTNRGFAGGNNIALGTLLERPNVKYILLLNSDTLAQPNVLKHCVQTMHSDPKIGVLGCLLLNPDQTVQNGARKLPTPLRMVAYSFGLPWLLPKVFGWANFEDPDWDRRVQSRDVGWVGGAFMLIRREVINRIGGLDERFFFYGEDAEFCRRVWKNGWRVRYECGAAIVHLGGASSNDQRLPAKQRDTLWWQARYLLQRRCYGLAAELLIRVVDITSFGLRYLKLRLTGRKDSPEFAAQRDILTMLLSWPQAPARQR